MYRQTQENGELVIGYNFNTVLRQEFDYTEFPFDREDVWVRIWHKDFDKNVILTPDLSAYTTTDPQLLPGLEQQDLVLEDWEITEPFFSYRGNRYNTNFGLTHLSRKISVPELYFNVGLERRFANIFISSLIPINALAFLLFDVLLTANSGREDSSLFGFSTSSVLSFAAVLFFVVIIAHVNLRSNLPSQGIIYLELFYFLLYVAILSVAINAIMIASSTNLALVRYKDNFVGRLLFWPLLNVVLLALTLMAFF